MHRVNRQLYIFKINYSYCLQYRGRVTREAEKSKSDKGEEVDGDDIEDEPVTKKGAKQKRIYGEGVMG